VHIYPICSAFYILSQRGFNDGGFGFCFLNGSPLGCWYDPGIPCKQSPESRMMSLLWLVPLLFVVIFPSIIMFILYAKVRQCQEHIFINATSVAKQAVVYLVALYWTVIPLILGDLLGWLLSKGVFDLHLYHIFPFMIFAIIIFCIFAFWAMLSYMYFSVEKKSISTTVTVNGMNTNTVEPKSSDEFIFHSQEIATQGPPTGLTTATATVAVATTTTETLPQQRTYSFNIFDGTNASGAFAEFIHDGDSDDDKEDNAATDHWAAVQDHM